MRSSVGLIDVGTLGKIEIYGPQAGVFLDRVYAGKYSDLKVGMTRYGLMLDESGVIIDDGVIARLAAETFYFTTTTGGSATVFRELLRLNALWGLDCALVNVTGHRAAFNFAGPSEPRHSSEPDRCRFARECVSVPGRAKRPGRGRRGAAGARRLRGRTGL